MKQTTIFLFYVSAFFMLFACTPDRNEQLIQGTWAAVENSGTSTVEWQFVNKTFFRWQENAGDQPLVSQGSYRVLESANDLLLLELYNIQGDLFTYNNSDIDVQIEVGLGSDRIKINRTMYMRVSR